MLITVGGLYLFRDNLPSGWFSFDYSAAMSTPSASGNLQKSVGGAFKRSADRFLYPVLLSRKGAYIPLPDLQHMIGASCPKMDALNNDPYSAHYWVL